MRGSKLALTKAGRAALAASPADTLNNLWNRWITNPVFDEFSRIDEIKGQTRGRGKRALTVAAERRDVIAQALVRCPVGRWVLFDDFSRFMRASSLTFEVTSDPWTLHLGEPRYGSLGFGGNRDWDFVQGRYVLCVLFEYAATLGLIDLAYTRPEDARLDFTEMSSSDSLAYLSRYDGLRYFRLNPLGAYCLDLTASYVPSRPEVRAAVSVYPDRRIQPADGTLGHDEILLLETYANREAADVWRLDGTKMLLAIDSGRDLDELREFIACRDEQELPEPVEGFLRRTERAARALAPRGPAVLFECGDDETLARLMEAPHSRPGASLPLCAGSASGPATPTSYGTTAAARAARSGVCSMRDRTVGRLCLPAGERHLVVPEKSVAAFRKAVHGMGFGMSRK